MTSQELDSHFEAKFHEQLHQDMEPLTEEEQDAIMEAGYQRQLLEGMTVEEEQAYEEAMRHGPVLTFGGTFIPDEDKVRKAVLAHRRARRTAWQDTGF